MELSNDTLALLIVISLIVFLFIGIIYAILMKKSRKGYTPINSVTVFGATSQFQGPDQKAATEHILEVQADKKMSEEESGDPDEK